MLLRNIWATDHTDQHGLMPLCIFRVLLCCFVANPFLPQAKKSVIIRAIRGLYSCILSCPFVPFRGKKFMPQAKKNPASAGLNKFRRIFLRQSDAGFLLHQAIISKGNHRHKHQRGHYRIFEEGQPCFIAKHQSAE